MCDKLLRIALALVLIVALGGCGQPEAQRLEQDFATPEAAIEHFISRLAAEDIQGALGACAVESLVEGYDYAAMTERLKIYMPTYSSLGPSEYQLFRELNQLEQTATYSRQIRSLVLSLTAREDLVEMAQSGKVVALSESDIAPREYIKGVNPDGISTLEYLRAEKPLPDQMDSEVGQANFTAQAKAYGGDEMTERLALLQCGGKYYATGFGLIRYGENWRIFRMNSAFVGQNSMGFAFPLEGEGEFEALLNPSN